MNFKNMCSFVLDTRRATIQLGQAMAKALEPGDLIVFNGGLGSGKTFLIRAILRTLGVHETIAVPSPTFTLMNEYGHALGARVPVLHVDLYRLLDTPSSQDSCHNSLALSDELTELGLRTRRYEGWALLIEWGRDAFAELGSDGIQIEFTMSKEKVRHVSIDAEGERGLRLANRIVELMK